MGTKIKDLTNWHKGYVKRGNFYIRSLPLDIQYSADSQEDFDNYLTASMKQILLTRCNISISDPRLHNIIDENQETLFSRWTSHNYISFNYDGYNFYCELVNRHSTYSNDITVEGLLGKGRTIEDCILDTYSTILQGIYKDPTNKMFIPFKDWKHFKLDN